MHIPFLGKKNTMAAEVKRPIRQPNLRSNAEQIERATAKAPKGSTYILGGNVVRKRPFSPDITSADIDAVIRRCPFITGPLNRFSNDLFANWHGFSPNTPSHLIEKILEFQGRTWYDCGKLKTFKSTLVGVTNTTLRRGDGFLELCDGQTDPTKPFNGDLLAVYEIDPGTMGYELTDDGRDLKHWVQSVDGLRQHDKHIHPSRIAHFQIYPMDDDIFGLSVPELSYNIAQALMNADEAEGEILFRFGHGYPVVIIDGADDELIKDTYTKLAKLSPRTGFVGDENYTFQILNPNAIDPEPFNMHFYRGVAATIGMPMAMLIGAQMGAVKGSEIDDGRYYRFLHSIQDTIMAPIMRHIYARVCGLDAFPYELLWNPIYVDEKAEAEVEFTRAKMRRTDADMCIKLMDIGAMDVDECRAFMSRHIPGFAPLGAESINNTAEDITLIYATHDNNDDEVDFPAWRVATDAEIEQAERVRTAISKQAARERALGEEIMREQDGAGH